MHGNQWGLITFFFFWFSTWQLFVPKWWWWCWRGSAAEWRTNYLHLHRRILSSRILNFPHAAHHTPEMLNRICQLYNCANVRLWTRCVFFWCIWYIPSLHWWVLWGIELSGLSALQTKSRIAHNCIIYWKLFKCAVHCKVSGTSDLICIGSPRWPDKSNYFLPTTQEPGTSLSKMASKSKCLKWLLSQQRSRVYYTQRTC